MASYGEKEYFMLKILAVVLIDIVKAENKEAMVDSLKELLQSGNMTEWGLNYTISHIPDMKKTGLVTLSSNLATLVNPKKLKKYSSLAHDPEQSRYFKGSIFAYPELPDPFKAIEISAMQIADFSYCITYSCFIDKSYHNIGIRNSFLNLDAPIKPNYELSDDQLRRLIFNKSDGEVTMRNYEEEVTPLSNISTSR